ncbi:Serine/threonine-protein phosphatase 4 catalytic subunit 1 [Tritrichomonas foetus]|uniref:Serine/threonine-protein phosphatase n=1 Tax=Tritrichomonas foetus TaxID=1144522 RepID=A0A1J4JBY4_9EUKA|nr:Serine/threonine-protein phosphatase 4 catalytic subunit 1 [Tritrichomonas foetus]|eukprot:OHS95759.1 Serine/threonine-protein phosphatase 4 catalytic subunit 1 [Tritrichomonas foetus]
MQKRVIEIYSSIFKNNETNPNNESYLYKVPVFSTCEVLNMCEDVKKIFSDESSLLELHGDFVVVGDLHGHFFDLVRIFQKFGLPPNRKYLFLGDLVDRGDFSLAILMTIFALKCQFTDHIFVIRGNHEFRDVCLNSGFFREINRIYSNETRHNTKSSDANDDNISGGIQKDADDNKTNQKVQQEIKDIFDEVCDVFSVLPLVAIVNEEYLCVHGGIGPKFQTINQCSLIPRPINTLYGGIADEILWSDPSEEINTYRPSKRGAGFEYGKESIKSFLEKNKMKLLIRAHQPVQEGFKYSLNNKVITIFSASNYCGMSNNESSVLLLNEGKEEEPFKFEPLPFIQHKDVKYILTEERDIEVSNTTLRKKKCRACKSIKRKRKCQAETLRSSQPFPKVLKIPSYGPKLGPASSLSPIGSVGQDVSRFSSKAKPKKFGSPTKKIQFS